MKKKIKSIIKKILHPVAIRVGFMDDDELHELKSSKDYLLKTFYKVVKTANFNPKHIVDVGANHGSWTREALNHFPNAQYSMLEPQGWLKSSSQDLLDKNDKIRFYELGAGSSTSTLPFTISSRDDSSTFNCSQEKAAEFGFEQIQVPVVTLNEFISKEKLPAPDIIKIDAEGFDLEVLKGASDFYGVTEVFLVEASINCKAYHNSLSIIVSAMDGYGYKLFDITDLNRPFESGLLWLVELAFVKKEGLLDTHFS
ncbi:MAG: FkbM family methyltransferase [Reichenbachiella sp.]|uniref:FkbM family methyltransferase n=1 Tax=Reichenbachiella sp. TaxID=2184521 RepID=UPI0032677D48